MKLARIIQTAHRWLGLILAVQVLLWMASGLIMSWFELGLVRGEKNAITVFAPELELRSYANPGGVIAQSPGATSVRLRSFLERPVYEVAGEDGAAMYDAATGAKLSPISEDTARRVARRDFIGDGKIVRMDLLTSPPREYGRAGPVWRATFDDGLKTHLYISPDTGDVIARRNKVWRLYDFFWMLHIMDYDERKNFNNPLLRIAAATGFLFALTGFYLVVVDFTRGRFLPNGRRRRDSVTGDDARTE